MAKCRCFLGHIHGSGIEAKDCNRHLADMRAGRNTGFKIQVSVPLHVNGKLWKHWKIDTQIFNPCPKFYGLDKAYPYIYFETKGFNRSDDSAKLKLSAFLTEYPDSPLLWNWHRATLSESLRILYSRIPGMIDYRTKGKSKARKKNPLNKFFVKTWVKGQGWKTVRASSL